MTLGKPASFTGLRDRRGGLRSFCNNRRTRAGILQQMNVGCLRRQRERIWSRRTCGWVAWSAELLNALVDFVRDHRQLRQNHVACSVDIRQKLNTLTRCTGSQIFRDECGETAVHRQHLMHAPKKLSQLHLRMAVVMLIVAASSTGLGVAKSFILPLREFHFWRV